MIIKETSPYENYPRFLLSLHHPLEIAFLHISPCSATSLAEYDLVIHLHFKSRELRHKIFR